MNGETFQDLTLVISKGVATITLNRVDAMNSLNMRLKGELAQAISNIAHDPEVRAVLITGNGKAFSAGGDIGEMSLNTSVTVSRERLQKLLADIFIPLHELEKPTIAAVNGHAHGAGLSLALACDIIVASDAAVFSCAFSKIGLLPDCGSMYFLPRLIGMNLAKELIFSGRRFTAAEAKEMGIVNHVYAADKLMVEAEKLAEEFASGPTKAFGQAKKIINRSLESTLAQIAELEAYGQATLYTTEDHKSAKDAFANKSTPVYKGR